MISQACYNFLKEVERKNIYHYTNKKGTVCFKGITQSTTGRIWTALSSSISGTPALRKGYIKLDSGGFSVYLTTDGKEQVLKYEGDEG